MRASVLLAASLLAGSALASDTECPTAPAVAGDRRSDKTKLRVVQYNAEFLFTDQFSTSCPGTGCPWPNATVAWEHLETVAGVVKALDADILNFCEVEGCDELQQLVGELPGMGYEPYLLKGKDSATGENVGLITRVDPQVSLTRTNEYLPYPVSGSQCGYTGAAGTYGVSKNYITTFLVNEIKVAMFSMHLLAFPTDKTRCAEREAQALVMRNAMVSYMDAGYEIIAIGDLNDFDAEVMDRNDNVPISSVLDILKGLSPLTSSTGKKLTAASQLMEQSERYTCWWDKNDNCVFTYDEVSMIDHVLLSDGLLGRVSSAFVYHGYEEGCDTLQSDHWPVVVDFTL